MPIGEGAASFVARIWLERHENGGPVWRGNIQHVQSGESQHFSRLAEMRPFIERLTGVTFSGFCGEKPEDAGLPD